MKKVNYHEYGIQGRFHPLLCPGYSPGFHALSMLHAMRESRISRQVAVPVPIL